MKAKDNKYYLLNPASGNENINTSQKWQAKCMKMRQSGRKPIQLMESRRQKHLWRLEIRHISSCRKWCRKVTLKVGDTYNIPGEIVNKTEVEEVSTLKAQTDMPRPIKLFRTSMEHICSERRVMSCWIRQVRREKIQKVWMKPVNFNVDDTAERVYVEAYKTEAGYDAGCLFR